MVSAAVMALALAHGYDGRRPPSAPPGHSPTLLKVVEFDSIGTDRPSSGSAQLVGLTVGQAKPVFICGCRPGAMTGDIPTVAVIEGHGDELIEDEGLAVSAVYLRRPASASCVVIVHTSCCWLHHKSLRITLRVSESRGVNVLLISFGVPATGRTCRRC